MNVGFTGTRLGMTEKQKKSFSELIEKLCPKTFHHGDCVGSDAEAHDMVSCEKHIHPPDISSARAFKTGNSLYGCKPYLERNKDIVNCTEILIATPNTMKREHRGGTWSTIRYAYKMKKKIYIIYPDGSVVEESIWGDL